MTKKETIPRNKSGVDQSHETRNERMARMRERLKNTNSERLPLLTDEEKLQDLMR